MSVVIVQSNESVMGRPTKSRECFEEIGEEALFALSESLEKEHHRVRLELQIERTQHAVMLNQAHIETICGSEPDLKPLLAQQHKQNHVLLHHLDLLQRETEQITHLDDYARNCLVLLMGEESWRHGDEEFVARAKEHVQREIIHHRTRKIAGQRMGMA